MRIVCVCLFVFVFVYCIATTQLQIVQANIIHSQQFLAVVVADFQSSRFQLANIGREREERGERREKKGKREWGGVEVDETTKSD